MPIHPAAAPNAQLAASYAALILADDGVEITADKLQGLIKKADVHVESVVPNLFAKVLEGKDAKKMVEELNQAGWNKSVEDGQGLNSDALSDKRVAATELLKMGGKKEPTLEDYERLIGKSKLMRPMYENDMKSSMT